MDANDALSRPDIARLLEVRRPTITIWQSRHPDFPRPVRTDENGTELFAVEQVTAWLANRVLPADVRRVDEPVGTTYADRLRRNLGSTRNPVPTEQKQACRLVETLTSFSGRFRIASGYLELVLTLLYLRCLYPDQWARLRDAAKETPKRVSLDDALQRALKVLAAADGDSREGLLDQIGPADRRQEIATIVRLVDGVPPASSDAPGAGLASLVFDQLIDRFADAEGRFAPDYNTPTSVARTIVRLLGPIRAGSRIHDPFCRTGDLLAAVAAQVAGGTPGGSGLTVTGRHDDGQTRRLAGMRLALLAVPAKLAAGSGYGFGETGPDPASFDVVLTNPKFNSESPMHRHDFPWPYGKPPKNANFGWLQYAVYLLGEGGRAVVVMSNNASFSTHSQESKIRRAMVEDGAVDCLIALPSHLFPGTTVSATLWILKYPTARADDVLFIDARSLGHMVSRGRRILEDPDIERIVGTYCGWRSAIQQGGGYGEVEGFSKAASYAEIRDRDYSLNPSAYVGVPTRSGGPGMASVSALAAELYALRSRAADIDTRVDDLARRLGLWKP
jgi:Type I restriction-modification system methyltransferase subunit